MKAIRYFSKCCGQRTMDVAEHDDHHLELRINGMPVVLNAVQVDKLRQQMHGWLHERANGADGANWQELS